MVQNIFNAYGDVTNDIDMQGHGTHVSATIGGATVGVAPHVNIHGCKVLSDSGSGTTSDVISALDAIYNMKSNRNHPPSIVSMSLGGPCDTEDCAKDAIVMAVEALSKEGVVVSVAAG